MQIFSFFAIARKVWQISKKEKYCESVWTGWLKNNFEHTNATANGRAMMAQKWPVWPFFDPKTGFFAHFGPQLAHLLEDSVGQNFWLKSMAGRFKRHPNRPDLGTGFPDIQPGKCIKFWPKIKVFQFLRIFSAVSGRIWVHEISDDSPGPYASFGTSIINIQQSVHQIFNVKVGAFFKFLPFFAFFGHFF